MRVDRRLTIPAIIPSPAYYRPVAILALLLATYW
jgi:hypothetical protein